MLKVSNLNFSFSSNRLLNGLTQTFQQGKLYSIVGPSGVGKSTFFSLITGENKLTSGEINLNDKDISHLKVNQRPIGIMFQFESLFPHLNVLNNILYPLKTKNNRNRFQGQDLKKLAIEKLVEVGLAGFEKRDISTLSGGQRQRVTIARTLMMKPEILLLDEPFSALDESLKYELNTLVSELVRKENIIALRISHDLSEAISFSDHILLMTAAHNFIIDRETLHTKAQTREVCQFFKLGLMLPDSYIPSSKLHTANGSASFEVDIIFHKKLGNFHHYMLEFEQEKFNFISDKKLHGKSITLFANKEDIIFYIT